MPYSFPENGIGRGRVAVCIRARLQSWHMAGKAPIMAMAFSLLAGAETDRLACGSRAPGAGAGGCTTRQYKTHNAEPREVQYPWHPWFGRTVWVYRIVVRGTRSRAHCGLDRVQCARSLEIPLWMLEAASCSTLRLAENPIVDCTALQRLKTLLHGGVLEDRHSSLGGADADPQSSTPRSTAGVVVSPPVGNDRLAHITARDSAKDAE